jgi:hypothetical protein
VSTATAIQAPSDRRSGFQRRPRPGNRPTTGRSAEKAEPEILFQTFFKSVGPRTYASQLKQAGNGNHFLVLTEGKRDEKTGEIRKTRLYLFSEDFPAFFRMLRDTAEFIRSHPVSPEVQQKRRQYWQKQKTPRAGATAAPQH